MDGAQQRPLAGDVVKASAQEPVSAETSSGKRPVFSSI